jgi:hypothetical protein
VLAFELTVDLFDFLFELVFVFVVAELDFDVDTEDLLLFCA